MNALRGLLAPLIIFPATILLLAPMLLAAMLRLLFPFDPVAQRCRSTITRIAECWLQIVLWSFRIAYITRFEVSGDIETHRDRSYLLLCNHLSWIDVPALLWVFETRLPFYRFFLKHSLIWMPLLGIAFWALEYPFVRFRSPEYLARHPEKRNERLETARRAAEDIRGTPTTIVNFPEGALFTAERHRQQGGIYRNLLRPHAGGTSLVISAMNEQLDSILDVTLLYPDGAPSVWQFLTNRVRRVRVHVKRIPIPPEWGQGDYQNDPEFRQRFRRWLNELWAEKDARIERLKSHPARTSAGK